MNKNKLLKVLISVSLVSITLIGFNAKNIINVNKSSKELKQLTKQDNKIVIGFSMDALQEARWQKDYDIFIKSVEQLGGEVKVQVANGNDNMQLAQAEDLIDQGVDVLVVAPHDSVKSSVIVDVAHKSNIPVIAYDRLIKNDNLDMYVSFDNEMVGELQAKSILEKVNKGNFIYIGGAETDNNAILFRQGVMKTLQPKIDNGDIKILYDKYTPEWKPENAYNHIKEAFANSPKVDAIICANDGTAGAVIQFLKEKGLAGTIPVTGQDSEIDALKRVVEGTQLMTIYKSIDSMAKQSAQVAMDMAQKKNVEKNKSVLLPPIVVTKDNIKDTVIKDKFHTEQEIYGK